MTCPVSPRILSDICRNETAYFENQHSKQMGLWEKYRRLRNKVTMKLQSPKKQYFKSLATVVHKCCSRWRLKANVSKCAVVVFSKSKVPGSWTWGEHTIPQASSYCYLGIDFTSDCGWDTHVKRMISNGRKKVNQLHSIISNRSINVSA